MSYVLIDAGNSCLKIARVLELDNNDIKNDISYNIIDYTDLYEDLFYELEDYTPSKVLVCNVSNPLNFHIISDVIYKLWQIEAHLVHVEQDKYGLTTLYSNPRTLGADRWVGMIAAREEFKKHSVSLIAALLLLLMLSQILAYTWAD
nr:type III pantothenate kinase [sulfur-oxidizing endosymbiont of Gigantopelta aegis]